MSEQPAPPVAERRPWSQTVHGVTLEDPYHWLKDASYPQVDDADVLAYLEAENAYFEAMMSPRRALVDALFEELKARQQQDDAGVPLRKDGHYYQWRYAPGGEYRIWSRWPADDAGTGGAAGPPADAQVILDEPALASGVEYFDLGALAVSNHGRLLAYSTDTSGAERYTLRVKDLADGELLADVVENTQGDPVWTADDSAFFYTALDEQWRPYQVRLHTLGSPVSDDRVIYEEEDPGFFVSISRTASRQHMVIATADHVTGESHLVPLDDPTRTPALVSERRAEHDYTVDHQGDRFVIKTNDAHKNARLVVAPNDDPSPAAWRTLVPPSDERYLLDFRVFRDFVAVKERVAGVDQIRLLRRGEGDDGTSARKPIAFPDPARAVSFDDNEEFNVDVLRLHYTSLVTPNTVYDYHVDTGELRVRKEQRIPSGYDRTRYATKRLTATARDGAQVPVSIVHARTVAADGSAPLYLYGYGAYGHATMPSFSTARLSLLDRGFVFAIAHVRGGDELGYHWYEAGKRDQRVNTFNDFVDVARHLVAQGFGAKGRVAIAGGSAGGSLMAAAVNQAPELWGAVAAHVPFVDVLNTMLDTSLPLTPTEWPEWGNPIRDAAAFALIRSYSPYDQLQRGRYPPMLVTAGLNDPRVTYWEPAKYVAKLRTLKEGDSPLLLKTNMDAGHSGKSGRFDALREVAEEYAFVLWALGEDAPLAGHL